MKSRPRGRYKKRKHDLILYIKIALICYLTIFGVGYMSSDTSAYLSSQSEFSETITAGIWEDPEVLINACGEEYTSDEAKVDGLEGDLTDCLNNDEGLDNAEEDIEIPGIDQENGDQNGLEEGEIKPEKDGENKEELDDSKVDEGQKPSDETPKQPDTNNETVTEPEEMNQTDQDSSTTETLDSSNE